MLISLAVTGVIVSLAAGAAVSQLRFFHDVAAAGALQTQVAQAVTIAANVLRDVARAADVLVATDSAVEASVTIGSSVTCAADTGRVIVARATPSGHTLAGFAETPQRGDAIHLLLTDGTPSWLGARVERPPETTTCARFPASGGWTIALAEPFATPAGAPVRITRRVRISLYRASDSRWYLGLKEWNGELDRFNAVQPVAGPLRSYSALGPSGLRFEYRDASGVWLEPPIAPARIAVISVMARGETAAPVGMGQGSRRLRGDSALVSVAIRRP